MDQTPRGQEVGAERSGSAAIPAAAWRPTARWRPGRTGTASGGVPVESSETGEVGFCKTSHVAQEKICSDLAREVGVNVPEVRLGRFEGHSGTVAVSMAHGTESVDLAMLQSRAPDLYGSGQVQKAIQGASGLLPFHAWVKTEDLKDDHLLVAEDGAGGFTVAAIDFSFSMRWVNPQDPVEASNGPPALTRDPDRNVIAATVEQIERCTDERIAEIVDRIPDDALSSADRERIIRGLQARRGRVRDAMRAKGWLP